MELQDTYVTFKPSLKREKDFSATFVNRIHFQTKCMNAKIWVCENANRGIARLVFLISVPSRSMTLRV